MNKQQAGVDALDQGAVLTAAERDQLLEFLAPYRRWQSTQDSLDWIPLGGFLLGLAGALLTPSFISNPKFGLALILIFLFGGPVAGYLLKAWMHHRLSPETRCLSDEELMWLAQIPGLPTLLFHALAIRLRMHGQVSYGDVASRLAHEVQTATPAAAEPIALVPGALAVLGRAEAAPDAAPGSA